MCVCVYNTPSVSQWGCNWCSEQENSWLLRTHHSSLDVEHSWQPTSQSAPSTQSPALIIWQPKMHSRIFKHFWLTFYIISSMSTQPRHLTITGCLRWLQMFTLANMSETNTCVHLSSAHAWVLLGRREKWSLRSPVRVLLRWLCWIPLQFIPLPTMDNNIHHPQII